MSEAQQSVSTADVRTALNEIDQSVIPDSTIDQNIGAATSMVDTKASDEISDERRKHAIIDIAAYRSFMAIPRLQRKEALDVVKWYDVENFIKELRRCRDEALEEITLYGRPRLYSLGER